MLNNPNPSQPYFEQVAGQWDDLQKGYFTEGVRDAAIQKAYLHPNMVVADVGAGTGFMASGLAGLVRQVHLVDGSQAMLDVARQKLAGLTNVMFHHAEGTTLPFEDASLDAVFGNMYLHHCPDPLAAIQEMVRVLAPGGRLVLTDMDAHTHTWMKAEMSDVWMGFESDQIRAWFEQAGLVNVVVDCAGQDCCAESQTAGVPEDERRVKIGIFVAAGTCRIEGMQAAVQEGYTARVEANQSCCGSAPAGSNDCCGANPASFESQITQYDDITPGYSREQIAAVPEESAELAFGCGNPTAFAGLKPGEVVLDIGSGAGMDAFLAAQKVGESGHVIGVDMTPAMLEKARRSAEKLALPQVEFRQGNAQQLPVDSNSVDVILSNCVINLVEDKAKVFAEAHRVLKPGGRLEISDMVISGGVPPSLRMDALAWSACVSGALPEAEYLDLIAQAGFKDIQVQRSASAGEALGVKLYSLGVSAKS